jgi:hypothetical protein
MLIAKLTSLPYLTNANAISEITSPPTLALPP